MTGISEILGGIGLLGTIAGLFLGAVLLFVLPFWAIIDCAASRRESGTKALVIVLLVVTWGLGCIFYGLFLPSTRGLRVFTVVALVLPLLILVPSVISLVAGASMAHQEQLERDAAEDAELTARFRPGSVPADAVEPFLAVHHVHGSRSLTSAALARFTLAGPESGSARDIDARVRHAAHDPDGERTFALTRHEFGTVSPASGRFEEIPFDPALGELSWPAGLAYDAQRQKVVVATSHGSTRFYRYDPRSAAWESLTTDMADLPLVALTYSPEEDCLYALARESRAPALRRIHRFNAAGALLGTVTLEPPIPIPRDQEGPFQLHTSSGALVLVLPPLDAETTGAANRIFAVRPDSGSVLAPPAATVEAPG